MLVRPISRPEAGIEPAFRGAELSETGSLSVRQLCRALGNMVAMNQTVICLFGASIT